MRLHGIDFPADRIAEACRRARVRRLWFFGSILEDDFRPDSDIDVLVEGDPANPSGLFALGGLVSELEGVLGREVHLTMLGGVPDEDRPRLLAASRLAYAA